MTLFIPCAYVDYRWRVVFAKFPQATKNADSSWLVFPHCYWTLSHADWSLLCPVSTANCHSASPVANCLLWVPSSNSLSNSLTHFRSRRRSRAQAFVWFRAKTDKGIVCLADHPHSVTHDIPRKNLSSLMMLVSTAWEQFYPISCQMVVRNQPMLPLPLQENLQVSTPECIIHLMDHLDNTTVDSADIRRRIPKDPVLSKVYQAVQSPEGLLLSAFYTKRYELSVENECQLRGSRMIITHTLRHEVLKELNQCQSDMIKMKVLIRNYVWWLGMDVDIEEKVNRCYTCQSSWTSLARTPLRLWEWLRKPWHWIHVNYTDCNGRNLLIVTDAHSKWIEVYFTEATNSNTKIEKLRYYFATRSLPNLLASDNGLCFTSLEFAEFTRMNGIKLQIVRLKV